MEQIHEIKQMIEAMGDAVKSLSEKEAERAKREHELSLAEDLKKLETEKNEKDLLVQELNALKQGKNLDGTDFRPELPEEPVAEEKFMASKLADIEKRLDFLDDSLPKGEKVYHGKNKAETAAMNAFGSTVHQAWRRFNNLSVDPEYTLATNTSNAGVLTPVNTAPLIVRFITERSIIRQIAKPFPMASDTEEIPVYSSGYSATWITEGSNVTDDSPTMANPQMVTKMLAGMTSVTRNLAEDAVVNVAPFIGEILAEQIAYTENRTAFTGQDSGADPIDGIYNKGGSVAQVYLGGSSTSTKTSVANLEYSDLVALKFAIEPSEIRRGVFVFPSETFQYITSLATQSGAGGGMPLHGSQFNMAQMPNLPDAVAAIVANQPTYLSETISFTDAADTDIGLYGSFDPHFGFGDRQQLEVLLDDSVFFQSQRRAIMAVERIAMQILKEAAFAKLTTAAS